MALASATKTAFCIHSLQVRIPYYVKDVSFKGLFFLGLASNLRWYSGVNSSHYVLLNRLGVALKEQKLEEALNTFGHFKKKFGYPEIPVVCRLITELSSSSDVNLLKKGCDLVLKDLKEKLNLVPVNVLAKLSLSLARNQMPIPACIILRSMLERRHVVPWNVVVLIVMHLVKSDIGTCLASNFFFQLCDGYKNANGSGDKALHKLKPDTMFFNLVLGGCVKFGSSLKGQEIIELMAQMGVVADANSIVLIAKVYEMNGQRDELRKYKKFIDQVPVSFVHHYHHFYESLLKLHFKFNDVDSIAEFIMDVCSDRSPVPDVVKDELPSHLVSIGSHNLKSGLKILIEPERLDNDYISELESQEDLLVCRNGKFKLSYHGLARLVYQYRKHERVDDLSKLLFSIQKQGLPLNVSSLCSNIILACVQMGWLVTAHDILDDLETAMLSVDSAIYVTLLEAYHRRGLVKEARALLGQMRKAGVGFNDTDEVTVLTILKNLQRPVHKSDLTELLSQEIVDEAKATPSVVYELNSSIYFFCKAGMMNDALNSYRKMQQMNIKPNEQTFAIMLCGYSSMKRHRDITILWGDIKKAIASQGLSISRDMCESLVLNFLRGGYFERVMEVIAFMKDSCMYTDKWRFRCEFLKLHKNLYRSLKVSKAENEAQRNRLEYVQKFRRWAGID